MTQHVDDGDDWIRAVLDGMSIEGIYRCLALRDRIRREAESEPPEPHPDPDAPTTPPRKPT